MKWFILSAVVIALVSIIYFKRASNNVCKTFPDYYTDRDNNENCYHNPDYELSVPDIITRNGYPVEIHNVTTEDGYILTMYRIPYAKNATSRTPGKPVFLQHGFASSSACFISTGQKSLGFILSNQGYDVWLGNFRGSHYSRNHIDLSDSNIKFWNFSFHEHGIYDMPAQLNHVSNLTEEKITYIGYSMGTMALYVYGVTYPERAAEQIKIFVNLAPSAFLSEVKSILRHFLPYWHIVEPTIHTLTNGKVYSRLSMSKEILKHICYPLPIQLQFCQLFDMLAVGFNYEQADPETLPIWFMQIADWSSIKCFTHLTQLVLSGNFQNYDYGTEINKKVYGSLEPPHYNLSKMKIPTYFIRAENDLVITKENVEKLYNSLPEEAKPYDIYVVKDENFNHHDFIAARDVVPLLYDHVLDFIRSY